MSLQTWQETLVTGQVAGTLFNTYTTTKTVLPVSCLVTLPANWWYIGRTIRVTASGGFSTLVTTPGTTTMSVNLGAVTIFTTGAVQLNATAHTTIPWELVVTITCRSVGSGTAATCIGIGHLRGRMFTFTAAQVDQVNIGDSMLVPTTAPAVGSGFDSTAAQTLDFFNGFSISSASNGIQVQNYMVEALN